MKFGLIQCLFLFLCLSLSQCADSVCGPDEIYSSCGSACPATCYNYQQAPICSEYCVQGCFCRAGMIRNTYGRCVRPDQCQSCPGQNEVYTDCGPMCEQKCPPTRTESSCLTLCVPGCFCKSGYVRDSKGNCILPHQCSPRSCSGPNEVYQCSLCDATCNTYGQPCPYTNNQNQCSYGCFCRSGYARNYQNSCVAVSQCFTYGYYSMYPYNNGMILGTN